MGETNIKAAKSIKKHLQEVKLSLEATPTMDEKMRNLNNRYSQLYSDTKRQERDLLLQKRKVEQANKEKDAGLSPLPPPFSSLSLSYLL